MFPNLLADPGFESGAGWTGTAAAAAATLDGATGAYVLSGPGTAEQIIDVSSSAGAIDLGDVYCDIGASLGGDGTVGLTAECRVDFRAFDTTILSTVVLRITGASLAFIPRLKRETSRPIIPALCRSIRISLTLTAGAAADDLHVGIGVVRQTTSAATSAARSSSASAHAGQSAGAAVGGTVQVLAAYVTGKTGTVCSTSSGRTDIQLPYEYANLPNVVGRPLWFVDPCTGRIFRNRHGRWEFWVFLDDHWPTAYGEGERIPVLLIPAGGWLYAVWHREKTGLTHVGRINGMVKSIQTQVQQSSRGRRTFSTVANYRGARRWVAWEASSSDVIACELHVTGEYREIRRQAIDPDWLGQAARISGGALVPSRSRLLYTSDGYTFDAQRSVLTRRVNVDVGPSDEIEGFAPDWSTDAFEIGQITIPDVLPTGWNGLERIFLAIAEHRNYTYALTADGFIRCRDERTTNYRRVVHIADIAPWWSIQTTGVCTSGVLTVPSADLAALQGWLLGARVRGAISGWVINISPAGASTLLTVQRDNWSPGVPDASGPITIDAGLIGTRGISRFQGKLFDYDQRLWLIGCMEGSAELPPVLWRLVIADPPVVADAFAAELRVNNDGYGTRASGWGVSKSRSAGHAQVTSRANWAESFCRSQTGLRAHSSSIGDSGLRVDLRAPSNLSQQWPLMTDGLPEGVPIATPGLVTKSPSGIYTNDGLFCPPGGSMTATVNIGGAAGLTNISGFSLNIFMLHPVAAPTYPSGGFVLTIGGATITVDWPTQANGGFCTLSDNNGVFSSFNNGFSNFWVPMAFSFNLVTGEIRPYWIATTRPPVTSPVLATGLHRTITGLTISTASGALGNPGAGISRVIVVPTIMTTAEVTHCARQDLRTRGRGFIS